MIYSDITQTIGNTPIVAINHLAPDHVNLYVKLEAFNPMGSVKDRLAAAIIDRAERNGELQPGQTVIEATSGNTGIALAMVCAARGYPFVAVMVETFSVERRKIMKALGAKVILTPAADKASGMVRRARELAEQNNWYLCNQFENPANSYIHRNTTAPEILSDFAGTNLDYWVTGWGTGGTLTGTGEVLKAARPELQVVVAEPEAAPVISGKPWAPHKIQGITPDFIPQVLNRNIVDQVIPVTDEQARDTSLALAAQEGIFVGLSAGAAMAAALQLADNAEPASNILVMLPDTGERYLSTFLCEGISETSDDDWLEQQQRINLPPMAALG